MKFIEEKLEKVFTLGQEGFRRIANAFGSTFAVFPIAQSQQKTAKELRSQSTTTSQWKDKLRQKRRAKA